MEIWKDIKGYEGYYQVSSEGQIKNILNNKILTGDTNNAGYRRVWLCTPVKKRMFVHRIVAITFCNGYEEDKVVNHKDGNKTNNKAENLEWVTRSENDLHAYKNNLRKPNPCKFKRRIAAYNKNTMELYKIYNNTEECCKDLKASRTNIYNCCNGKQLTCKGYKLAYYDLIKQ